MEERLLALRQSLNTPVVSTAELAAGPARAVIVVYGEGPARRFAVVVRSLRDGATVVYELDAEDARDEDGWSVALDASLSFGESMGFLFDDETIVDRRPETLRRALACLHEILAPPDVEQDAPLRARTGPKLGSDAGAKSAARVGSPDEMAEILLEDELDALAPDPNDATGAELTGPFALRAPPAETQPAVAAAAAPAAPAASPSLSKFRGAPAAAAAPPEADAPGASQRSVATLGRVRPVRLRVDAEAAPKSDPLVRLLADF
ncbi:MAG: hypothetical protein DCC71_04790 [Proteobacteria bacterium]|nr:MAG: hypothetical protein DCC71_04790 [Pseudomonadota bacterium]